MDVRYELNCRRYQTLAYPRVLHGALYCRQISRIFYRVLSLPPAKPQMFIGAAFGLGMWFFVAHLSAKADERQAKLRPASEAAKPEGKKKK